MTSSPMTDMTAAGELSDARIEGCPFCGEHDPTTTGIYGKDMWWIRCDGCTAQNAVFATEAEAIAAWNRRAPPSPGEPVAVNGDADE